jgi:hypothetical protein
MSLKIQKIFVCPLTPKLMLSYNSISKIGSVVPEKYDTQIWIPDGAADRRKILNQYYHVFAVQINACPCNKGETTDTTFYLEVNI